MELVVEFLIEMILEVTLEDEFEFGKGNQARKIAVYLVAIAGALILLAFCGLFIFIGIDCMKNTVLGGLCLVAFGIGFGVVCFLKIRKKWRAAKEERL